MSLFVSSKCMLELNFAVYHKAVKMTGFLTRCMQNGLKNHWSRHLFKHRGLTKPALPVSMHANCFS